VELIALIGAIALSIGLGIGLCRLALGLCFVAMRWSVSHVTLATVGGSRDDELSVAPTA